MSLDVDIVGGTSGVKAETDANKNLFVNLPLVEAQAGYATQQTEIDPGEVIGSRTIRQTTSSIFNRASVGLDTVLFSDYFNATAQNTALWTNTNTTFTIAFGTAGYNVFNNSSITTTGAAQILQSYRSFTLWGSTPLMFECSEFRAAIPATNQVFEFGLFSAGGTPFTPTDGVFFRMNSNGLFGIINFNGTETSTQLLTSGQIVVNDNTTYRIVINHYRVEFWGASATSQPRILLKEVGIPSAQGPAMSTLSAPISFRLFHSGTAGSAVQAKIANAVVTQMDTNQGQPVGDLLNGMGLFPQQGSNGQTMGSTALYTNSLAAGAGAAMTNTTAALGTGLGGQFSAQPTLAAGTDGILCSYQNPVPTVTKTGRTIMIEGVRIQGLVTTALTGGPIFYAYSLAIGHTAVSLATAEGAATKAPRRIALGYETYVVTAPVGTLGQGVFVVFNAPIPVNAGEFVAIVAKNQGTVTSAGVVTFLVTFDAYQL